VQDKEKDKKIKNRKESVQKCYAETALLNSELLLAQPTDSKLQKVNFVDAPNDTHKHKDLCGFN
jgi:hypothetical protein